MPPQPLGLMALEGTEVRPKIVREVTSKSVLNSKSKMTSMHIARIPVILGLAGLFGILYRTLFSLLKRQGKVSNMTVSMILRGQCWNATESVKAYQETVGLKSILSLLGLKPSICLMLLGVTQGWHQARRAPRLEVACALRRQRNSFPEEEIGSKELYV